MNLTKPEIVQKANYWINNQDFDQEMIVLEEFVEEHNHCFSLLWCVKSQEHLIWGEKSSWCGLGRILISKDGEFAEFEGSSPHIDWIHHFELKIRSLEAYFYLEIPFEKKNISKLKSAIKCSTKELLNMVDKNDKIVFTESKSWCDHFPKFYKIVKDLNISGIDCKIEVKTRQKSNKKYIRKYKAFVLN